jgi:hypothetical protein
LQSRRERIDGRFGRLRASVHRCMLAAGHFKCATPRHGALRVAVCTSVGFCSNGPHSSWKANASHNLQTFLLGVGVFREAFSRSCKGKCGGQRPLCGQPPPACGYERAPAHGSTGM